MFIFEEFYCVFCDAIQSGDDKTVRDMLLDVPFFEKPYHLPDDEVLQFLNAVQAFKPRDPAAATHFFDKIALDDRYRDVVTKFFKQLEHRNTARLFSGSKRGYENELVAPSMEVDDDSNKGVERLVKSRKLMQHEADASSSDAAAKNS